ncbi:hypothetical protein J4573_45045 [Actinomadura barringtoniae]|uniref:Uncharacterized protein n=1 Tax=Actinomadura barringtoniae TaxID=1427535 RepID=A0A939PKI3_9ACTN|nr:hypothetical protein [Actinomadura barringtoniae]MBO2454320.1 hypothetical protein [Actinomadura barringtoniae]
MKKFLMVGSVVLALGFSASACNSDSKKDSDGATASATATAAQGGGDQNGAPSSAPTTSKAPGGGAAQGKNDTEIDAKLRACLKAKGYNNLPKETIRSVPVKGVKDSDVMACMS